MIHHVRRGETIRVDDPTQELWCPVVKKWMTREEHKERFGSRDGEFNGPTNEPQTSR